MTHTHFCPRCHRVTITHCHGTNAGVPDCPPVCEYQVDDPDFETCEDYYAEKREEGYEDGEAE